MVADAAGDDVSAQDVQETLRVLFEAEDTRDHPMEMAADTDGERALFSDETGRRS